AITVLESYIERSDRARLVAGIMQICEAWQQEIERRNRPEDLDRFYLAKTVLTYHSQDHEWQLRLLDLANEKSVVRPAALKLMEQLVQDQAAGSELCYFLGMEAMRREDYANAHRYLEQ